MVAVSFSISFKTLSFVKVTSLPTAFVKVFFGNLDFDNNIFKTKFGKIQNKNLNNKFRYKLSEDYLKITHQENLEIISSANGISKKDTLLKFSGKKAFEELRYKPFLGLFTKSNQNLSYANVNKYGFQMSSNKIEKSADVKRVVIIGGSSAFGYGAYDKNENITNLLESYLNNQQKEQNNKIRWEVINLAFFASQTLSDLNILNMYASILKPDYVIHLSGYNDFFYFFHSDRHKDSNKKLFQFHGSDSINNYLYQSKSKKIIKNLPNYIMIIKILKKLFSNNINENDEQIYTVF